jgi:two-component system response regulator AlgR|tara:strand:+ start:10622 stop:11362 length:741 start_codon:yes stop_codon:yes gene_type:complete
MSSQKTISIFIVDDENLARERLKRLIESAPAYSVIGEAENGEIAIKSIPQLNPDIVLLDIRMPGEDGLAVAEKLSEQAQTPAIIFCTAYDEYAISAFKYNAIGYLLKPVRKEELMQALSNAQKLNQLQVKEAKQQIETKVFVANTWQGQELIPLDSIYFFKSDHKYLTVIHEQGETLSDQTLKDLEQEYQNHFIRVHRNTLVNKYFISSLVKKQDGHYEIHCKNCTQKVTVSRRHVTVIKDFLNSL